MSPLTLKKRTATTRSDSHAVSAQSSTAETVESQIHAACVASFVCDGERRDVSAPALGDPLKKTACVSVAVRHRDGRPALELRVAAFGDDVIHIRGDRTPQHQARPAGQHRGGRQLDGSARCQVAILTDRVSEPKRFFTDARRPFAARRPNRRVHRPSHRPVPASPPSSPTHQPARPPPAPADDPARRTHPRRAAHRRNDRL
jgi:hypothetical protein